VERLRGLLGAISDDSSQVDSAAAIGNARSRQTASGGARAALPQPERAASGGANDFPLDDRELGF